MVIDFITNGLLGNLELFRAVGFVSVIKFVVDWFFSDDDDYDAEAVFKLLCNYIFYLLFVCTLFITLFMTTNAFNENNPLQIKAAWCFVFANLCYFFILQYCPIVIKIALKTLCASIIVLLLIAFVSVLVMGY